MMDLWHFAPLYHAPSILLHGAVYSIEELERRGLRVIDRASREDDIARGVGNVVKVSTQPYWHMLSRLMRDGIPHILVRFSADPVLWADTTFGDRNVWENGWNHGDSYEFAEQRVFVRKGQYAGGSPPEIYVARELPLTGVAISVYTYLREETGLLEDCLQRLGIRCPTRLMTAGERNWPFPDRCHDDYMANRGPHLDRLRRYFAGLTIASLRRGVEIEQ